MECKVASIYFAPVTASRRYRGNAYTMPAVPLGEAPAVLTCYDLQEHDEGPHISGTNKRQKFDYVIKGEEIARCIVGQWTGSTTVDVLMEPGCHPGIWVVRDKLPVTEKHQKIVNDEMTYEERLVVDAEKNTIFRPATAAEFQTMWEEDLAEARRADRNYAEACWNDGNRIHTGRSRGEIVPTRVPPIYKLAAKQYGLDAEWLKEAASSEARPCPHCEKLISRTVMICQFCTQPVDLAKWARWTAAKEAALLEAQTAPEVMPAARVRTGHAMGLNPEA